VSGVLSGVLSGGWEFVWAAYGITAAVFVGYTLSLLLRVRGERARRRQSRSTPEVTS
jgi:hypothetical protein